MSEKKTSPEQQKNKSEKSRDNAEVVQENTQRTNELAKTAKGYEQKEKKWKIGFGTTDAKDPKNILNISTTGMKFQNKEKDLEFTIWAASISEQQKPGELPKNSGGIGASLNWKF